MKSNVIPEQSYTRAWSDGRGEVKFFTRSDGSRLRYFTAGTGPPLVLLHTVRTQLDYFQRVIPLLWDSFTVYALDLPGMGWSDIAVGASYEAPDLRAAVVEFVTASDLHEVTLAGNPSAPRSHCPHRSNSRTGCAGSSRSTATTTQAGLNAATGSPGSSEPLSGCPGRDRCSPGWRPDPS